MQREVSVCLRVLSIASPIKVCEMYLKCDSVPQMNVVNHFVTLPLIVLL